MTIDEQSPRFSHIVLDSGPLFQSSFPPTLSESYWTVPEVIAEIKDEATRDRMGRLPFELKVRAPSVESLQLVQAFARETGDEAVLSATDLRVLALVVTLEMEVNGEASKMRRRPGSVQLHAGAAPEAKGDDTKIGDDAKVDGDAAPEEDDGFRPARKQGAERAKQKGELDEGEWITPDTIHRHKGGRDAKRSVTTSSSTATTSPTAATAKTTPNPPATKMIGCISSDFAMQNVLLQMRLRLYSPEGYRIRRLKNWLLRCHACFHTTKEMGRKFCPACGGPTLMRTSYSVDSAGQVHLYLKANFQYNNRGSKYSIPMPKGGRNASNLMLREDQVEYQRALKTYQRAERKAAKGVSIEDIDDRLVSVFGGLDLKGGGASLAGFNDVEPPVIGYGRRNPNQARRTKK
jgi:RNA-binding protein NOB1